MINLASANCVYLGAKVSMKDKMATRSRWPYIRMSEMRNNVRSCVTYTLLKLLQHQAAICTQKLYFANYINTKSACCLCDHGDDK